jgi:hypothetical protein
MLKKITIIYITIFIISLIIACGGSTEPLSQDPSVNAGAAAPQEEARVSDKTKSVDAQDLAKVTSKAEEKAAQSTAGNVTVATGAGWGSGTSEFDVNMAKAEQTNKLLEAYWMSHTEYTPEIAKELLHPEYLEEGSMTIDEQIDSLKSEGAKITFETDGTAARTGSLTLGMSVMVTHPTEGELKYYMTFKETEKKNNEWRISNVEEMESD